MPDHPALQRGRTAAITGAASGIGLAAAKRFAALGMNVAIADRDEAALAAAASEIGGDVVAMRTDVSRKEEVDAFCDKVYARFGEVGILMNNAGHGKGGSALENYEGWQRVIGTNLWGVVNGVQSFAPRMIAQGSVAAIVNTGSKQGITTPPGDTAYNVSKAGVKVATEGLQHTLRTTPGCRVTAHLLVPGWTFTGLTARGGAGKPAGAWWPDQVVDVLIEGLGRGDFYIICPDNEVTRDIDNLRIRWAAGDITENRPPLSRWHPDYQEAFAAFLKAR